MSINLREKLHQKVDQFSDEQLKILAKVADLLDKQGSQDYADWSDEDWQNLAIQSLWKGEEIDIALTEMTLDKEYQAEVEHIQSEFASPGRETF